MSSECYNSQLIKEEACQLGFDACGIAQLEPVEEKHAQALKQWLTEGKQGEMSYLANHTAIRLNPALLLDGAESIIVVALGYYPKQQLSNDQYQFAWYAYGKDYHDVVKEKLKALSNFIEQHTAGNVQTRVCCDTAPLLEKYWAWKAGLGWIGKHTQLIIPNAGSCFFLGEILVSQKADCYDKPQKERCGSCHQCIDACPQHALEAPYKLNASRCLSYLTIEHRGSFPQGEPIKNDNYIYGCDACLKACPWNRFAKPTATPELQPSTLFMNMKKEDWEQLSVEQYRTLFKGSAVKRAKYEGLVRNIEWQKKKNNL